MGTHKNTVVLIGPDISDVEYISGSTVLTKGQDRKGKPKVHEPLMKEVLGKLSSHWRIDLECGRKGSEKVAEAFMEKVGDFGNCVLTHHAGAGSRPDKLNFFFELKMAFKKYEADQPESTHVWLGQGHNGFENDWWIACNDFSINLVAQDGPTAHLSMNKMGLQVTCSSDSFTFE